MTIQTSRRQMLGAMALAPAIVAPAIAVAAAPASDFYRLVAEADRAEKISATFHEQVWQPAYDETGRRCEALPHTTVTYRDHADIVRTKSTANPGEVSFAESMVRLTTHDAGGVPLPRTQQLAARERQGDCASAFRTLVAADRRRKRAAGQIREAGLAPYTRQSDAYNARAIDLYSAAIACSVASLPELRDKMALIERLGLQAEHFDEIAADVARLAGKAVQ